MESARKIRELRESINMSRKEFSNHTGIPIRTLEDWEAGRRTPPAAPRPPAGRPAAGPTWFWFSYASLLSLAEVRIP